MTFICGKLFSPSDFSWVLCASTSRAHSYIMLEKEKWNIFSIFSFLSRYLSAAFQQFFLDIRKEDNVCSRKIYILSRFINIIISMHDKVQSIHFGWERRNLLTRRLRFLYYLTCLPTNVTSESDLELSFFLYLFFWATTKEENGQII